MTQTTDYDLYVLRRNDEWVLVDAEGQFTTPELAAGSTLTFHSDQATLYLQFPQDDLFQDTGYTTSVAQGNHLKLTCNYAGAEQHLVYSVFCVASNEPDGYAKGGSPPKVIVKPSS